MSKSTQAHENLAGTEVMGWTITFGRSGLPNLEAATVTRAPTPGQYFRESGDDWLMEVYTLGDTFFTHRDRALEKYIKYLEDAKNSFHMAIAAADEMIELAQQTLQQDFGIAVGRD